MEEIGSSANRAAIFGQDWTKGSIVRNLLQLSWPMIISYSLNTLGPTIDMIWVGKLGSSSIAAVGISGMAIYVMNSAKMGLVMGARAMIARSIGAGDVEGANHVARQGFVISIAFSVLMAAIGILFAKPILILMGVEADIVPLGASYMRIMLVGSVAMSFRMMTEGIMQASGDGVMPMRIAFGFRLFHAALCPFLVFGWWIFPRLGVSGAAMANVISHSLGAVLGFWILFTGRSRLRLTFINFRFSPGIIWRIMKIGIPASIMSTQESLAYFLLTWIMIPFGTVAVAAHSLIIRIEMILFMPGWGLGMAAGVLVGQNLGAGQPERAERSSWLALALVEGMMIIFSVLMLLWPGSAIRLFTPEPSLVEVSGVYLRIAVVGFVFLGIIAVFIQCLAGAGDTMPLMVIGIMMSWLLQLPLAYFLPRVTDYGVYGVRWAIVIGIAVGGIAYLVYFRLGRWKRKTV